MQEMTEAATAGGCGEQTEPWTLIVFVWELTFGLHEDPIVELFENSSERYESSKWRSEKHTRKTEKLNELPLDKKKNLRKSMEFLGRLIKSETKKLYCYITYITMLLGFVNIV